MHSSTAFPSTSRQIVVGVSRPQHSHGLMNCGSSLGVVIVHVHSGDRVPAVHRAREHVVVAVVRVIGLRFVSHAPTPSR